MPKRSKRDKIELAVELFYFATDLAETDPQTARIIIKAARALEQLYGASGRASVDEFWHGITGNTLMIEAWVEPGEPTLRPSVMGMSTCEPNGCPPNSNDGDDQ